MQYRAFGQLDWKPSALGFGAMRLPVLDGGSFDQIDESKALPMLRSAIDHGVNYVDTAYNYHDGASEVFLGRALQNGYRERVKLATKLPCWKVEKADDLDRFLGEQLERLQTDHIDFYLFHALTKVRWDNLCDLGVLERAERAIADGRIHHLGFSFHDQYEALEQIVDGYDGWTFCQIQYNYMDIEYQAGSKGLRYATDRGLAVVVMEPLRGGQLARGVPQTVQTLWDHAPHQRTPADWALQWVWNQPEVAVVLSGMTTMEQVQQNVASAEQSGPATLTAEELALVAQVRDEYQELAPIPCTGCRYCMPCPNDVRIAPIFEFYNQAIMYDDLRRIRRWYGLFKETQRGDACSECGQCMEVCPQQLEIPQWLQTAHELLHQPEGTSTTS